jgi:KaiB domain
MNAYPEKVRSAPTTSGNAGMKDLEICLRLYVASSTPNSERAEANLDAALREFPDYRVEIIDVLADAKRAVTDSVIVTPTLVALGPKRRLVMVGDLSDLGKLRGLLKSAASLG